jgi:sialate O-acetylesterase
MKAATLSKFFSLIILCFFSASQEAWSQDRERIASLNGDWQFSLGDNVKFAQPGYDDSEWEEIFVPSSWQREGFQHYYGYAWYRKKVAIEYTGKGSLFLELGRIDDVDEVYFNGHLIGGTGGFPPDYYSAYNYYRKYLIPQEYLNKKGKNVIAVRVYDEGGEGGMVSGTPAVYAYENYSENSINLFGKWKFHLNDDVAWSKENVNDADWEDIIVPSTWEAQGFHDYDGFAWYRKNFQLPKNFNDDDLMILLGKIDDMDEVFINGELVGRTGRMSRQWASNDEWSRYRTYEIPEGLLKPGKSNVIAVRVFDQHGDGGIYEGPVTLLPRDEYKQFWKTYRSDSYDFFEWLSYILDK